MNPKYVYKVVRGDARKKERLISCIITEGAYCLTYALRRKTFARPGSPGILVFESPFWADNFVRTCMCAFPYSLLKCRYSGEARIPRVFWDVSILKYCYRVLTPNWMRRKVGPQGPSDYYPQGTRAVDSVTPMTIEKVYHAGREE